jgi:O-antigen ligase/Flp pilus assembly protein TadD
LENTSLSHLSQNSFQKLLLTVLSIFIVFISLFIYKEVYNHRINQKLILILFIIIFLALWAIKILSIEKITWTKSKLNLPLCFFIAILTISLFTSNIIKISLGDYLNFISYIILFFIVLNFIKSEKEFNSLIKVFFVTSFLVSFYTIIQYYGFDHYYGHLGKLTSTIGQKNWISNYLAMIFPIGFSYFLLQNSKKIKLYYFLFLSILYTTLLICQSRGIWISIILTIIFAFIIIFKYKLGSVFKNNKKWLFALLIVFLVITTIYSTENPLNKSRLTVAERALSTFKVAADPSINTRFLMWKVALEMFKDSPFFGLGIGTFKYHYLYYQAEYLVTNPSYVKNAGMAAEAHNEYLQLASEIGIVGLVLFLAIIFLFYYSSYQWFKKNGENRKKMTVFGLILGITCFLIHCMVTFPLHVPVLGATFFIILGLALAYMNISVENTSEDMSEIRFNINGLIKYILLFITIILAFLGAWGLAIKPYLAEINYFKGAKYFAEHNNSAALEYFLKAAQLDSDNGRIMHALGSTYYQLGLQEEAQKILQQTTEIYNDRNTYRNLSLSYLQSGNYEKAQEELEHAIYLDPKFWEAYNDLASLYVYQGEYEKAIEIWQRAIDLDLEFKEKHIFLYYIGVGYQRMDDNENAYEYFLEALKEAPDDSPIMEDIEQELLKIFQSTNVSE